MGSIVVQEFSSLDGVFEDPGWTAPYGFTEQMGRAVGALTGSSGALLLGRRTWEMFAPAWSARSSADDPGVAFFNDSPKYVVTSTELPAEQWQNSTAIGPYDPAVVRDLADRVEGNLYVSGSGTLVRALIADGLDVELHLLVYPVVLGRGARLFPDGGPRLELALREQERFENGVAHLVYGPAG